MRPKRSPLLVIFLTIFLDLLGFGIVIPLLPFFATELGASGFEVGILMTAYSGMQFLCSPLWGRLSDRIGRRPVLLVSITGNVLAMLLFASSTTMVVFFLARAFAGMANANIGTAQAYIADITGPEDRAKGMGLIGAAFGLGFVLGPAIGGLISHAFGSYGAPAYVAAGLSAINLLLAFRFLPESLPLEAREEAKKRRGSRLQAFRDSLSHPFLPFLFLIFFLTTVSFAQMETTFALFTRERFGYDAKENGYLFAYIGVVLALVQGGLVQPLRRKIGEAAMLLFGTVGLTVGLLILPLVFGNLGLLAGLTMLAVGNGLSNPALSSLVSKQAPVHAQGQILGVNQSMSSLGRVIGPLIGGFAFEYGSSTAPFYSAAAILCLALVACARIFRNRGQAETMVTEG